MANAATHRLKIAPMSAPSTTPIPTARPAKGTRSHRRFEEVSTNAASAKKSNAKVIGCEATPQQAAVKKPEFRVAASPPRMQAIGTKPNCRKKHQAPSPSSNKANGA